MKHVSLIVSGCAFLIFASLASAQVPLSSVLSNLGFEDDATTTLGWTATRPNTTNYTLDAFEVNPVIVPLGAVKAIIAPSGVNFVGVLNAGDDNTSGKLVHDVGGVTDPAGTTYTVTVWGTRGRLAGASSAAFTSQPSRLLVTFLGWGVGSAPVVNEQTDNWSRQPLVRKVIEFTAWGPNGGWTSQEMRFTTAQPLAYVTLAVSCVNHVHNSFCAVDFE